MNAKILHTIIKKVHVCMYIQSCLLLKQDKKKLCLTSLFSLALCRILSSMLPFTTNLYTVTCLVWPNLCARSIACVPMRKGGREGGGRVSDEGRKKVEGVSEAGRGRVKRREGGGGEKLTTSIYDLSMRYIRVHVCMAPRLVY